MDGDYKIDEELSLLTVTRTGKCQICFIYLAERPLRFDALPCPATVDEAVELLGQYDMNFSLDSAHHFSIADATGRSAVVEWMGDVMYVSETNVVTNHYLAGKINNQLKQEVHNYEKTDCHLRTGL